MSIMMNIISKSDRQKRKLFDRAKFKLSSSCMSWIYFFSLLPQHLSILPLCPQLTFPGKHVYHVCPLFSNSQSAHVGLSVPTVIQVGLWTAPTLSIKLKSEIQIIFRQCFLCTSLDSVVEIVPVFTTASERF